MRRAATPYISLVIPTRNEADNVQSLVAGICKALPGPTKELVFVDDSDDATPLLLQRILAQADCPGLVVQRSNGNRAGGLSTAVVRGFHTSSGQYICTMDADLQHPTSAIPALLETAEKKNAQVVVGSRYMQGGRAHDGFDGRTRYLVSLGGRRVAHKLIAGARMTSDPLSGFFLVHRSVVDGVELRPVGYKILLEVLVRGRWSKAVDVPYAFHSRNEGVSKATMREGMRFARHVGLLVAAEREARRQDGRAVPAPAPAGANGSSPGHGALSLPDRRLAANGNGHGPNGRSRRGAAEEAVAVEGGE